MLADDPRVDQSLPGVQRRPGRTSPFYQADCTREGPEVAVCRPIQSGAAATAAGARAKPGAIDRRLQFKLLQTDSFRQNAQSPRKLS